jgi:hypothetical protein
MPRPNLSSLAAVLSDPANAERTPEQLASLLWDAMSERLTECINPAPPVIREGLAFHAPWSTNLLHVVYQRNKVLWLTWGEAKYGFLVRDFDPGHELWQYITPSRAKKGGAEPHEGLPLGSHMRLRGKRSRLFVVRATTATAALLEGPQGHFQAEPFDILKEHFIKQ